MAHGAQKRSQDEDFDEADEANGDNRAGPSIPKKQRNRVMRSCVPCHKHKRKCDRGRPCGRCSTMGAIGACVYEVEDASAGTNADSETTRLRNRVAELENVVRSLRSHRPGGPSVKEEEEALNILSRPPIPKKPEPESDDSDSDMDAPGSPINGNSSLRHHPAPMHSPQPSPLPPEPFQSKLLSSSDSAYSHRGGTQHMLVGAAAAPLLLARLNALAEQPGLVPPELVYDGLFPPVEDESPFRWTLAADAEAVRQVVFELMPQAEEANALLGVFQAVVELQHRAWFSPQLQSRFSGFFAGDAVVRLKYDNGMLALICSVLALSCLCSESGLPIAPEKVVELATKLGRTGQTLEDGTLTARELLSRVYGSAVYALLKHCDLMPTLESVQAELVLAVYLSHSGHISRFAQLLPNMVRHAQMLGLHIDPKKMYRSMPFVEQEIRRRMWWSLQEHDIMLSLLTGLPPTISSSDCDLPQDRTESSLLGPCAEEPEPLPGIGCTLQSFQVYRLECTLYAREILVKVFKLTTWHWSRSPIETAVPGLEEVTRIDAAIKLWYHRIPPALCYEIDAIKGTPLLPPRPGTTDRDLSTRSEELATQSLLLVIYAQAILLVLHRPFLHSTIWQVEIAHTAERQVFNSALTIVLARCRLGAVPLSFWADTFAFQAALTLAHLSGRFLTGVHQRRAELDAARAGLRAAIEHFSNVPGAQHEEKARVLTVLEAVLQRKTQAQLDAPRSQLHHPQEPPMPHTAFSKSSMHHGALLTPPSSEPTDARWSSIRTSFSA